MDFKISLWPGEGFEVNESIKLVVKSSPKILSPGGGTRHNFRLAAGISRSELNVFKIAGLVKRADPDQAAFKSRVGDGKQWLGRAIHKNFNRPGSDVAHNPDVMPIAIRQRRRGGNPRNAFSIPAVNHKDAIVDRLHLTAIHRHMGVIEMERVNVIENNDHRAALATNVRLEIEAAHRCIFDHRILQRPARHAWRAAALHVQVVLVRGAKNFPVLRKGKLPGAQIAGFKTVVKVD